MKRGLWLLFILVVLLVLDLGSKAYVHANIPLLSRFYSFYPYGGVPVFQNWHGIEFSIVHVINKGAAWGMFASCQMALLCGRIVVVAGMILHLCVAEKFFVLPVKEGSYFARYFTSPPVVPSFFYQVPLIFVLAGAIGNIVDYFAYGHVIDMFHFRFGNYTYPIFNVADSAIFCGIFWLICRSVQDKKRVTVKS
jgi:signal peptidase II